jgi:hypothetical protein
MYECKRLLVAAAFALLAAGGARPAHAEDLRVGRTVKVFTGPEGEEIAVVPVEGGARALIRFKGVDGEFEGKVYLHDVHDLGERGMEYALRYQGRDYTSVLVHSGWGGERSWEIAPPPPAGQRGRDGIRVHYSETRSQATRPEQLLAEYQQQQRALPAAQSPSLLKKPVFAPPPPVKY